MRGLPRFPGHPADIRQAQPLGNWSTHLFLFNGNFLQGARGVYFSMLRKGS